MKGDTATLTMRIIGRLMGLQLISHHPSRRLASVSFVLCCWPYGWERALDSDGQLVKSFSEINHHHSIYVGEDG